MSGSAGYRATACAGKHGFPSPDKARAALQRARGRGRVNLYRCDACGLWHIGSRAPNDGGRRR